MLKILKTFYGFLLQKRLAAALFFVSIIVSPLIGSIQPYFYKLFVDAIPNMDYEQLSRLILVFIGFKFAHMVAEMLAWFLGDVLVIDAFINAKNTVFKHIHNLDFAFHAKKSSGSLISAIRRGDGALWSMHHAIHFRIVDVAIRFFVMLYFFEALNRNIFYLVILSVIVALAVTKLFIHYNIKTRSAVNDKEDDITAVIVDNMINFETVKLFAKESWERVRLNNLHKDWKNLVWKNIATFRGLDLGMGMTINISILLVLFASLRQTINGNFSIGDFVLVVGFVQSFYPRLFELVWGFRDIAKNYTDIEKYFGILDYGIEVKDRVKAIRLSSVKGEVEFKNVTFGYEGENLAVKNINLSIRQGQSVALVGSSGAGKTTIIKLLLRFMDPQKGSITIDGVNIKNMKKSHLRSFIGVVPQEPILFNNTIKYNIAYGRSSASFKEIEAAAKLANIHDFILSLPKGYETHVGERGIKLSGGQKQRVSIARMILSDPQIIIFDEATSQLDSKSEKLIQDAFWKASKDKTTIIIAHRLSTIKKADKIAVLEKGKVKEEGSHKMLLSQKTGLYKYFWGLQTEGS